jgi:threonine synthase
MSIEYICSNSKCSNKFKIEENALQYKCLNCSSPLALVKNIKLPNNFKQLVKEREPNLWRYKEALPLLFSSKNVVSLGEGMTPLVDFESKACQLKLKLVGICLLFWGII